jgi:hypothetical protein
VLNPRRKQLVKMAFRILDKDGSGMVEMSDIKGVYNASSHPDVVMDKRTEEEILVEFMMSFQVGKDKDSVITPEEFENYYANLSASIDSDDYFELMIRNAWHISGGEGWCANTTNRRVLVTHADGRQTVEEIKDDIGLAANDKKGMVQRLKAQGLKMASINTNGLGDLGNQYEDPDFVKFRNELEAQSDEVDTAAAVAVVTTGTGRLSDFAAAATLSSTGGSAGTTTTAAAPLRSTYSGGHGAGVNGYGSNKNNGLNSTAPVKPTSLSSFVGAGGNVAGGYGRRY